MRIGNAIAALGLAALAGQARGNAALIEGYFFDQPAAGTVTIRVQNYDGRNCPDSGLLRRDAGSGAVVRITACDPTDPLRFIDRCVPAGEHQYGLADALACTETSGTERYATLTVTDGAAPGCTPDEPVPVTVTDSSAEAWPGEGPLVCDSSYGELPPGCGTGGAVMGLDAAVLAAGLAIWRRRAGRRRAPPSAPSA